MNSFSPMSDLETFKTRLFRRKHLRRGVQLDDPSSPYEIADQRCFRELTNGCEDKFDRDRCRLSRDALIAQTYRTHELLSHSGKLNRSGKANVAAMGRWLRAMWKIQKSEEIERERSTLRLHPKGGLLTQFVRKLGIEIRALLVPFDPAAFDRHAKRSVLKTGYVRRQRYEPYSPHEIADQRMIASSNDGWADCFDEMRHRVTSKDLWKYIEMLYRPLPPGEYQSTVAEQNDEATRRWLEETRDLPVPEWEKWKWPFSILIYPPLNEAFKPDGVFRVDVEEFTQQPVRHVIRFSI